MDKILTVLDELIDTLTFRRVLLVALLISMGLGLYIGFENRNALFDKVFSVEHESPTISAWELSDISKSGLIHFSNTAPILYLSVIEVDLKKNRRSVKFRYSPIEKFRKFFESKSAGILPQAVFDSEAKNTQQMVAVLSNEFNCAESEDTIYQRLYPELASSAASICRIAVPPFAGQFAGYLAIALSREVTKTELDSIRLEAIRLAIDIYTRDIIKN